jgi:catechol 2,3-dioxygenase-like lactoylglutathione lyase family enzyme
MFNHIMVGATDIEASKKFYDATLGVLGAKPGYQHIGHNGVVRYMYFPRWRHLYDNRTFGWQCCYSW